MLKVIIIREIQNHLISLRFQIGIVLVACVFIIGTISSISDQINRLDQYNDFHEKYMQTMKQQAESNVGTLAVSPRVFVLKPRSSMFIADCREKYLPNAFEFSAWNVFSFKSYHGSGNHFLTVFKDMNWTFVVSMIMGFLILLFTFDSVSGEKETGTLSLTLSNVISKGTLLFGKWVAAGVTASLMLVLGIICSLLIIIGSAQVTLSETLFIEILMFFFFSLLFLMCMAAFGILSSVLTRHANVSLLISLSLWLFFAVVIPNSASFAAKRIFTIEAQDSVRERVLSVSRDLVKNAPEGSQAYDGSDPFFPKHKLRAALYMKMLNAEKKIRDAYYRDMFRQFESTRSWSVISPVCLYEYMAEAAVGGGYLRFKETWKNVHIYQVQLLQFFKDIDAADDSSPHWYNPYEDISTTRKPAAFDTVPLFQETVPDVQDRIEGVLIFLLLSVIYTVLVFALSFVLFIRYDVR